VYADPNPTPAPNATAAQRVVGLLNNSRAVVAPAKDPYTNFRKVTSMLASHFLSNCDGAGLSTACAISSCKLFL